MKLLALDTATEACSVALLIGAGEGEYRDKGSGTKASHGGNQTLYRRFEIAPRRHADLLLPMIEEVLREADISLRQLDALAFGQGPGSFTGVRIASSVVQALAFAADLPVAGVSNLAALAQAAWRKGRHGKVLAAIDARMQEVYWGCYAVDGQLMRLQGLEQVTAAAQVSTGVDGDRADNDQDGPWYGAGTGWGSYTEALEERIHNRVGVDPAALPDAQDIALLGMDMLISGHALPAEQAQPVYLRNNVAKKSVAG